MNKLKIASELLMVAKELIGMESIKLKGPLRNYDDFADLIDMLNSFGIQAEIPDERNARVVMVPYRDKQKAISLIRQHTEW